jgi:hypothetical protein
MTRETKLGLVVAGSFLTLVGGVVVARLKHVEMPGDQSEAVAKAEGEPAGPAPAEKEKTPVANATDSPKETPPQEPIKHKQEVSSEALAHAGDKKLPPAPPTDTAPPTFPPADPPSAVAKANPTPPVNQDPPSPAPMTTPSPAASPPPAEPVNSTPIEKPSAPPAPSTPTPEPVAPTVIATPPQEPKADPKEPKADPKLDPPAAAPQPVITPPTPPVEPSKPPEPPKAEPTIQKQPDPAPVPATVTPLPEPPAPPPLNKQEAPPTPTVIKQPANETPAAPPLNQGVTNAAAPSVTKVPEPAVLPSGATLDAPRVPTAAPAPRDQFAAATAVRPVAPPQPTKDSYLEEQHRWKPGDNFANVSSQYYMSPKYADALLKYNQDYPLATREMRQNPPALAPGQVIWIPPARILERDYPTQLGGLQPIATPTSRPSVEPVGAPPGLANSNRPADMLYRVRQPGESVQEIARRTLGNSFLASRIQGMNPTLSPDPRLPIPAGTILRLPGDANVNAADRP